jgi:hypothetical protein
MLAPARLAQRVHCCRFATLAIAPVSRKLLYDDVQYPLHLRLIRLGFLTVSLRRFPAQRFVCGTCTSGPFLVDVQPVRWVSTGLEHALELFSALVHAKHFEPADVIPLVRNKSSSAKGQRLQDDKHAPVLCPAQVQRTVSAHDAIRCQSAVRVRTGRIAIADSCTARANDGASTRTTKLRQALSPCVGQTVRLLRRAAGKSLQGFEKRSSQVLPTARLQLTHGRRSKGVRTRAKAGSGASVFTGCEWHSAHTGTPVAHTIFNATRCCRSSDWLSHWSADLSGGPDYRVPRYSFEHIEPQEE